MEYIVGIGLALVFCAAAASLKALKRLRHQARPGRQRAITHAPGLPRS